MSVNTINLVGRAGQDPQVRYFESGSVVVNFSLAVNRLKKDDQPDWINLEIWAKTAEIAAQYVKKGSLIGVTGSLKFEHWKDRTTGGDRKKAVVKVDRLELLGSKADNQAQEQNNFE
jgi:single-strand DNA-binding protein